MRPNLRADHCRQHGVQHIHRPEQIDLDDFAPELWIGIDESRHMIPTGAVHQCRGGPDGCFESQHRFAHHRVVGDIDNERCGAAARGTDLGGGIVCSRIVDVPDTDRRTFGRQAYCNRTTDAACGAGDDRATTGESAHHGVTG